MTIRKLCLFSAVLFVTCFAVSGGSVYGADAKAEEYYSKAKEMYDHGAFMPAIDLVSKAISIEKDTRFYLMQGYLFNDVENRPLSYRAFMNAFDMIVSGHEKRLALKNPDADSKEFKTALYASLLKDNDYVGLVPMLVSQSIDLRKYTEAKRLLAHFRRIDKPMARMESERLYLEIGRQKLENKAFSASYRAYAKAAEFSDTKIRSRRGCAAALSGLATQMEEKGDDPKKLLGVLLRLHRFDDSEDTAIRIKGAFIKAGRPADKKAEVKKALKQHKEK